MCLGVHPPSVASATRQHGDRGNSHKGDECSAALCDQSCDTQRQQTLWEAHTNCGHNLLAYYGQHTYQQLNWQIRLVQQHVIFGLICSLWQQQDIHKDTLAGHYTFASPFDRMLCSEQFNSPPKPTFIEYYCQNSGFVKISMNGQHAKCLNPNFFKKSPRTLGMSDPICVLLELNEVGKGGKGKAVTTSRANKFRIWDSKSNIPTLTN